MSEPSNPPPLPPPSPQYKPDQPSAGERILLPVGRSSMAIVAGYLALFSVLILPAPFALGTGLLAYREIKKSQKTPTPKHGMGRAIFGIVMGAIFTSLLGFVLISFIINSVLNSIPESIYRY